MIKMRRESALIFGLSLILTITIVGGLYYLSVIRNPNGIPATASPQTGVPTINPTISQSRSVNEILKCADPEVGIFYTNAPSCEEADLENRLSFSDTVQPVFKTQKPGKAMEASTQTLSKPDKPSIRRVAKSVPSGLSASCKFPVGKALETERVLSASDDPAGSIWRENYCKWVRESRQKKCEIESGFFYYDHLCTG